MPIQQPQWDSLHLDLLHIYDDSVLPWGRKVKEIPTANYYRAWLLRSGQARVKIGARWHTLQPGEWLLPSPALSAQEFSDDARLLSLHFRARWPDGSMLFDVGSSATLPADRHPELETNALLLRDCCRRETPARYGDPIGPDNLTLDQHLHVGEILRRWLRVLTASLATQGISPTAPAAMDARVRDGLRWLDRFPLRTKFREPILAEYLGLSVIHLNRLFASEIKRSPATYLEQRRWERATYLLLNSSRSAKEIAYALGFCSPSYFATWVKTRSGKTPLQFRKRLP